MKSGRMTKPRGIYLNLYCDLREKPNNAIAGVCLVGRQNETKEVLGKK